MRRMKRNESRWGKAATQQEPSVSPFAGGIFNKYKAASAKERFGRQKLLYAKPAQGESGGGIIQVKVIAPKEPATPVKQKQPADARKSERVIERVIEKERVTVFRDTVVLRDVTRVVREQRLVRQLAMTTPEAKKADAQQEAAQIVVKTRIADTVARERTAPSAGVGSTIKSADGSQLQRAGRREMVQARTTLRAVRSLEKLRDGAAAQRVSLVSRASTTVDAGGPRLQLTQARRLVEPRSRTALEELARQAEQSGESARSSAKAQREREEAEQSSAKARREREEAEQSSAKARREREEAERSGARARREREEAEQSGAQARREREEAEQSGAKARREREEAEQSSAKARREREEAEQSGAKAQREREKAGSTAVPAVRSLWQAPKLKELQLGVLQRRAYSDKQNQHIHNDRMVSDSRLPEGQRSKQAGVAGQPLLAKRLVHRAGQQEAADSGRLAVSFDNPLQGPVQAISSEQRSPSRSLGKLLYKSEHRLQKILPRAIKQSEFAPQQYLLHRYETQRKQPNEAVPPQLAGGRTHELSPTAGTAHESNRELVSEAGAGLQANVVRARKEVMAPYAENSPKRDLLINRNVPSATEAGTAASDRPILARGRLTSRPETLTVAAARLLSRLIHRQQAVNDASRQQRDQGRSGSEAPREEAERIGANQPHTVNWRQRTVIKPLLWANVQQGPAGKETDVRKRSNSGPNHGQADQRNSQRRVAMVQRQVLAPRDKDAAATHSSVTAAQQVVKTTPPAATQKPIKTIAAPAQQAVQNTPSAAATRKPLETAATTTQQAVKRTPSTAAAQKPLETTAATTQQAAENLARLAAVEGSSSSPSQLTPAASRIIWTAAQSAGQAGQADGLVKRKLVKAHTYANAMIVHRRQRDTSLPTRQQPAITKGQVAPAHQSYGANGANSPHDQSSEQQGMKLSGALASAVRFAAAGPGLDARQLKPTMLVLRKGIQANERRWATDGVRAVRHSTRMDTSVADSGIGATTASRQSKLIHGTENSGLNDELKALSAKREVSETAALPATGRLTNSKWTTSNLLPGVTAIQLKGLGRRLASAALSTMLVRPYSAADAAFTQLTYKKGQQAASDSETTQAQTSRFVQGIPSVAASLSAEEATVARATHALKAVYHTGSMIIARTQSASGAASLANLQSTAQLRQGEPAVSGSKLAASGRPAAPAAQLVQSVGNTQTAELARQSAPSGAAKFEQRKSSGLKLHHFARSLHAARRQPSAQTASDARLPGNSRLIAAAGSVRSIRPIHLTLGRQVASQTAQNAAPSHNAVSKQATASGSHNVASKQAASKQAVAAKQLVARSPQAAQPLQEAADKGARPGRQSLPLPARSQQQPATVIASRRTAPPSIQPARNAVGGLTLVRSSAFVQESRAGMDFMMSVSSPASLTTVVRHPGAENANVQHNVQQPASAASAAAPNTQRDKALTVAGRPSELSGRTAMPNLSYSRTKQAPPAQEAAPQVKVEAPRELDPVQLEKMIMKLPQLHPDTIADQVYKALERKMKLEQRRRGY
jgi:hypothetical protein